jgi:hypothetical protein
MPRNLIASDVVVTATPGYDVDTSPDGRVGRKIFATLVFGAGDASLTYPANGIPLPGPQYFYMNFPVPYRWIDFLTPVGATANILYCYDPTPRTGAPYGTIRMVVISSGAEVATNEAVAVTTLHAKVQGK